MLHLACCVLECCLLNLACSWLCFAFRIFHCCVLQPPAALAEFPADEALGVMHAATILHNLLVPELGCRRHLPTPGAPVRMHTRACVRACVHACVRACMRVFSCCRGVRPICRAFFGCAAFTGSVVAAMNYLFAAFPKEDSKRKAQFQRSIIEVFSPLIPYIHTRISSVRARFLVSCIGLRPAPRPRAEPPQAHAGGGPRGDVLA